MADNDEQFRMLEEGIYSCLPENKVASYDNKAAGYEFLVSTWLYNKLMWGTTPAAYKQFARQAVSQCKGRILDVGCGGLTQTAAIYAKTENPLVLLDYSTVMLRIGKERLTKARQAQSPLKGIIFLQADAFDLPFEADEIDNVFSFGMLHLFDNKAEYLDSLMRVLKPGGRFFFSSLNIDRPFSKRYYTFLHSKGGVGTPLSSSGVVALFGKYSSKIEYYCVGSMVFVSGVKK